MSDAVRATGTVPLPAAIRLLSSRLVSCSTATNNPGPMIAVTK
jgi:hypothetical protein